MVLVERDRPPVQPAPPEPEVVYEERTGYSYSHMEYRWYQIDPRTKHAWPDAEGFVPSGMPVPIETASITAHERYDVVTLVGFFAVRGVYKKARKR